LRFRKIRSNPATTNEKKTVILLTVFFLSNIAIRSSTSAPARSRAALRSGIKFPAGLIFTVENEMIEALKNHWPEYLIEAWCLATFMISAAAFGVALFHPGSPLAGFGPAARSAAMGAAMGATAVLIVVSPWGRRSGAHFNPAVTLAFFRLGKIAPWDAAFYVGAQFAGGAAGIFVARLALGDALADGAVNYLVTVPGGAGAGAAFAAEVAISFVLMTTVLVTGNSARLARLTPYLAGALVAVYIPLEAPLSGMSMNPARSFASALAADVWTGLWVYFTAPPLAMLAAAEFYRRAPALGRLYCAKFHRRSRARCIFSCRFGELVEPSQG
jgi:aquaporin Z